MNKDEIVKEAIDTLSGKETIIEYSHISYKYSEIIEEMRKRKEAISKLGKQYHICLLWDEHKECYVTTIKKYFLFMVNSRSGWRFFYSFENCSQFSQWADLDDTIEIMIREKNEKNKKKLQIII